MNAKIAYLGKKGSFSYAAANELFGENFDYLAARDFAEVFSLLKKDAAHYAVVPIENSLAGSIYENYDFLHAHKVYIVKERYKRIEHCLLSSSEKKEDAIKQLKWVVSHPKALEQCKGFFHTHPWIKGVASEDTASAAFQIAEKKDPAYGAIASVMTAEIYGLSILQKNLEDDPNNYTRFICLSKDKSESEMECNKCSLVFTVQHLPGTLYEMLSIFALHQIDLTKIESRPIKGRPFEYLFYVDLEWQGMSLFLFKQILEIFKTKVEWVKNLGFYKSGALWKN